MLDAVYGFVSVSAPLPVFLCLCSVVVFLPQCLCSWTCVCVGANSGCVSIAVFVLVFLLPGKVMWAGCSEEQRFILCLSLCSCVCWSQMTCCIGSWLEGACVFCVQVCTPLIVESAELVGFLLLKRAGLVNL